MGSIRIEHVLDFQKAGVVPNRDSIIMKIFPLAVSLLLMLQASDKLEKEALRQLYSSDGWNIIDKHENGREISVKSIQGKPLRAVMVSKRVNMDAKTLLGVIYDVANYERTFVNSSQVTTTVLQSKPQYIDAYQHLPVPIPFISDRHYVFRMESTNENRVTWRLVSYDNGYKDFLTEREREFNKPVYLESGIGIWDAIENSNNSCWLSYRVYMDSGGNLPHFLIDWLNRKALATIFEDVLLTASSLKTEVK